MSEEVSNPTPAEVQGVSVEDPRIREYTMNMARMGVSKEEAQKRIGMPREVIDKLYREAERLK